MGGTTQGRTGEAFRRLLAEAASSPQARVDALIAASQRTVWVATWEPRNTAYRTLQHEDGHLGLPVFSDEWELEHAAIDLGWSTGGEEVKRREIGMREAMRTVLDQNLAFLVMDLASTHCIEATRAEIEPLVRTSNRSDSHGPFAAVGRITSSMMEAVRASQVSVGALDDRRSRPPSSTALPAVGGRPPSQTNLPAVGGRPPSQTNLPAVGNVMPPPGYGARSSLPPTTPGAAMMHGLPSTRGSSAPPPNLAFPKPAPTPVFSPSQAPPPPPLSRNAPSVPPPNAFTDATATLAHVNFEPNEVLLTEVSAVLKHFPEVEWAAFCMASIEGGPLRPVIGVRVDPAMQSRLGAIADAIDGCPSASQSGTGTLLLDRLTREARADGVPFHPWRRKRTGQF